MTSSRTKEPAYIDCFGDNARGSNESWERQLQEEIVRSGEAQPGDADMIERLVARTLEPSGRPRDVGEQSGVVRRAFGPSKWLIWSAVAIPFLGAVAWAGSDYFRAPAPRAETTSLQPRQGESKNLLFSPAVHAPVTVLEDDKEATEENSPKLQGVRAKETATPGRLFAQAKLARRKGDLTSFFSLGVRLQKLFPSSSEAQVARIMLAAEHLRSGAPGRALAQYNAYLKRGGTMSEEALAGRARALGQLGQAKAELKAWQVFSERYPQSVHSSRANQRISQLTASLE